MCFEKRGVDPTSVSTRELHADFRKWRAEYPGEPYWVHFQTTDVHWPHNPPPPFAGLFVSPGRRQLLDEWDERLKAVGVRQDPWSDSFEKAGVDRIAYFSGKRDLYAEAMAHQDSQLERLVEYLKNVGEWENTLLIIAADHAASAGAWDYDTVVLDPLPPMWGPMLRPGETRIPMIFVWPGHLPAGKRLPPTGLHDRHGPHNTRPHWRPATRINDGAISGTADVGQAGLGIRPVIFDEFYEDPEHTASFAGKSRSLTVDGGPHLKSTRIPRTTIDHRNNGRPVPLLLYDLWEDRFCLKSLHEERPGPR